MSSGYTLRGRVVPRRPAPLSSSAVSADQVSDAASSADTQANTAVSRPGTPRSYRDVVVGNSRDPGTVCVSTVAENHEPSVQGLVDSSTSVTSAIVPFDIAAKEFPLTDVDNSTSDEDHSGIWHVVQRRRRVRSLGDTNRKFRFRKSDALKANQFENLLTEEQAETVRIAENGLTEEQRQAIANRDKFVQETQLYSVQIASESEETQPEEAGPSYVQKGKFVDNENDIDDSELNVEQQKKALDEWNRVRDAEHRDVSKEGAVEYNSTGKPAGSSVKDDQNEGGSRKRKHRKHAKSPKGSLEGTTKPMSLYYKQKLDDAIRGKSKTPTAKTGRKYDTQPVNQLPKSSSLAKLLKKNSKPKRKSSRRYDYDTPSSTSSPDSDSDSEPSESSDSDNSMDPSESPSLDSGSDDGTPTDPSTGSSSSDSELSSSTGESSVHRRRRKRSKHSRKSRKSAKKRRRERIIKPIPPTPYDGTPDAEKYHAFVMECQEYCKAGRVSRKEQCFLLSHYLRGKAKSFFIQKVARNHAKWDLLTFFTELFNFCFPMDYRSQQREKIKRCYQNSRSVSDYVYELETLYNLVGATSKREKVIKLWDGFNAPMRRELHRAKLNKEVHSWNRIVQEAELIELADFEVAPRKKSTGNGQPTGNGLPSTSSNDTS
ncbi:hypothetical protein VKT23_008248 [Stygiomarasmius scandens]|uniref:Retrotransposon gag domain-containing protein n=1 Tax=Marasmiellus scandens TaxID=2682957 RepID=A0ABR1JIA8_9AGAR